MNIQVKDPSYFKMVSEHQQLSERVLRLEEILSEKKYTDVLTVAIHNLLREMKNIVMLGETNALVDNLALDPNELPFIDPEVPRFFEHEFEVGDIVNVPNRLAQHKFIVSSKQRFVIERLIGSEQLQLKCICGNQNAWTGFNLEITGHYSHFSKIN